MRILTVCSKGNKRSVYTRYLLEFKHDVLALGCEVNSPETIKMLAGWAELILLAEPQMKKAIPRMFQYKVDDRFTIGPDIYPTNITGQLKDEIYHKLKELEYIK